MTPADQVTLELPRGKAFHGIANLVLGGLASRLQATVESLEDLQLALETLLERAEADSVTVTLSVTDGVLETLVGPVADAVRSELAEAGEPGLGLQRVLRTVADEVDLSEREGAVWVTLRKSLAPVGGG